ASGKLKVAGDIRRHDAAGRELGANELQGQLPPMRVARQAQADSQFRGTLESLGVVTQEDIGSVARHETLETFQLAAGKVSPASGHSRGIGEVDADQVERFRAGAD